VGQILLKIGITRNYFLPIGICETDTFKNKNIEKGFLAIGNMWDM
jgi:hypothetical protein